MKIYFYVVVLALIWLPVQAVALGELIETTADDFVFLQLGNHETKSVRDLRAAVNRNPKDTEAVEALVHEYLSVASATGDERYLSYALGVLNSWSNDTNKLTANEIKISLLRVRVLQRIHDFAAAQEILDDLFRHGFNHAEAALLQAYISMSQGDYLVAKKYCAQAVFLGGGLYGLSCNARAIGMVGDTGLAYAQLAGQISNAHFSADEQTDALLTLAELAELLGNNDVASQHYHTLLDKDPNNIFVTLRYCDFLLDQASDEQRGTSRKAYEKIVRFTEGSAHPGMLLRNAIAKKELHKSYSDEQLTLANFYQNSYLRDPLFASADYALYLSAVADDPQAALDVAQKNWEIQKNRGDLLILLDSALSVGRDDVVADLVAYIKKKGLQDVRIGETLNRFSFDSTSATETHNVFSALAVRGSLYEQ